MNAYRQRMPMLQAAEQLRQLPVITFPHIGGDSKNPKTAAAQAARKRRRMIQDWQRQAQGLGKWDVVEGVDALETSTDVRRWLGMHGIVTA
jgi:hypothetical protein